MERELPAKAVVRFDRKWKQFNVGERASFEIHTVKLLAEEGIAVIDDPKLTEADLGVSRETESMEEQGTTDLRTHTMSVPEVQLLVADVESLGDLQRLWDGEQLHPSHPGGRRGALAAIRTRANELKARHEVEEA
jgi:hypothetical protein